MPREGHDSPRKWLILRISISIHVPREGHDAFVCNRHPPSPYFNPRAPRGARRFNGVAGLGNPNDFNPRAPRGARLAADTRPSGHQRISIHVPREGHDRRKESKSEKAYEFQSTCPARGTTPTSLPVKATRLISIHVPREGHDPCYR